MKIDKLIIRKRKVNTDLIPQDKYDYILENFSSVCVESLIVNENGELLLVKRREEPIKEMWCTPGGRVFKDELLEEAVIRKSKQEVGLEVKFEKTIGMIETFFEETKKNKRGTHILDFLVLVTYNKNQKITLGAEHSEYGFFKNPPKNSHPFTKKVFNFLKI